VRNVLIAILVVLSVSACENTEEFITKEKPVVIMPDREMLVCPNTVKIPDISTLTDLQVAQVISELKSNLEICKNKLQNVEIFLNDAKKRLEK